MKAIAEFVVRVADLLEAEGRSARVAIREEARRARDAARGLMLGAVCIVAAGVFLVAGLSLLLNALYLVVVPGLGAAGALALTGAVALVVTGALVWICMTLTTERSSPKSKRPRAGSADTPANGMLGRRISHETPS